MLAHLLRVPSIVFAVNKLDAVANPAAAYVGDLRRRTEKSISGHKRDWLERVVGQRLAAEVLDEAEQSSKELEGRGVHFKGRPAAHPVEQYIDQVRKGGEE